MTAAELILLALGLAADAFSVSVCKGLAMKKPDYRGMLLTALFFGIFQGAMPLAGYLLGSRFEVYISRCSHWAAFLLLGFIGGKMIAETLHSGKEQQETVYRLDIGELLVLALATSIDAFAVGVVFAAQGMTVGCPVAVIAAVTFALSLAGAVLGRRFGSRLGSCAELAGGTVLMRIGIKLLLDGVGTM
jgi:putative Mn2+ efflux pump MntP